MVELVVYRNNQQAYMFLVFIESCDYFRHCQKAKQKSLLLHISIHSFVYSFILFIGDQILHMKRVSELVVLLLVAAVVDGCQYGILVSHRLFLFLFWLVTHFAFFGIEIYGHRLLFKW